MAGMLPGTGSVPTAEAASKSQLQNRLAELKSARAEANAAVKALEGEAEKYSEKIAALDYQIQSTRAQLNTTQKIIDSGRHKALVYGSLAVLVVTMVSYLFLSTGIHLLAAGFFFGLGYGILQPLFQSFVTGTTPALSTPTDFF